VVTRSAGDADTVIKRLIEVGATTIHVPVVATADPLSTDEVTSAATRVGAAVYSWIVFSSAHGVERFGATLDAQSVTIPATTKVAAVGPATASALSSRGVTVDLVPDVHTGAELADALGAGTGRVLLPRPEVAPGDVLDALSARGWSPEGVIAYRTVAGSPDPSAVERVRAGDFDVLTFTSGSTVRFFTELVSSPEVFDWDRAHVACIGPSTAGVARSMGFPVDVVAEPHTVEGLVSAVLTVVGR
jgi:uroporphyrinogen-III synthase